MKKVIIADDSLTMRRLVENLLAEMGEFEILTADGGDVVMELLNANPDVSLVLMDWNMPVMNGLECLKQIRANPGTEKLAVIMVTSEALRERIMEALHSGANNYLMKPFDKEKFRTVVEAALSKCAS